MNVKVTRFKISNLRNMEYVLVVLRIIEIVERHVPDALHLRKSLNRLKAFVPELQRIEAMMRKWRKSRELDECEHLRDDMVDTLIRTERNYAKVSVPETNAASKMLTALFDKHKRDIATDTDTAETQRIYKLVEDVERDAAMLDALTLLALMPFFNMMKEANRQFDELWKERNRELGEENRANAKAIRAGCDKALTALANAIEHCSGEYDDLDYQPLAKELNRQSDFYKQQLKARATRRKNGEKTEEDIKPLE